VNVADDTGMVSTPKLLVLEAVDEVRQDPPQGSPRISYRALRKKDMTSL